ncbi:ras-related protein RABH1a isoform X2 [Capsella rubella]|uniref:ras-related protein RABH1a isoform X2 n=1 Tax=Capsella rubella TaxID=81985 RepID=UPI000CD59C6F|nr:ras-related protein RABH1a isoform X2 [Capsella rubella]
MENLGNYKLVFLGDQAVGKTSIITCFMYGNFDTNYQATIGVDFLSKTMRYEDRTFRLQLWDTAGQERFQNKQTFLNTSKWIQEVRAERGSHVIVVLVGNKTDLIHKRQVSIEEGDNKASEFGALFMETSAKAGFNIKPLFCKITSALQGNEAVSGTKQEDLVDVNLKASTKSSRAEHDQVESSCC